jgi:insertion element IS1 protein InsB
MVELKTECRNCNGASIKNGKSKSGRQRYYCRSCKKNFQTSYSYMACGYGVSRKIVTLLKESCGVRSISRILHISATTVISQIKSVAKKTHRPFAVPIGKEYEVDEMRTFVGNKKRLYWIVYALRRDTKEVIDFTVGKRTTKTLLRVLDTVILSDAKCIYTDGYLPYKNLLSPELHCQSAYQINHIERKNLSIRTHLKRLSRKTICFSKSREMLAACLKIYFWGA